MLLALRKTVIANETTPNDYSVIHEGRGVGRIRLADELSWQGTVWAWNVNPPLPIPSWCNGTADRLGAAKAEFRAAWERFYLGLTPEDIAFWHRTEDLKANASWAEKVDWSRRFDDPIELPDGRVINTIGEAAEYALALPSKIGSTPPWQRAANALHKAAEHGGPFVFMARISFYGALHGKSPPPIGNPKERRATGGGRNGSSRGIGETKKAADRPRLEIFRGSTFSTLPPAPG